jgi:hypothetical protein
MPNPNININHFLIIAWYIFFIWWEEILNSFGQNQYGITGQTITCVIFAIFQSSGLAFGVKYITTHCMRLMVSF